MTDKGALPELHDTIIGNVAAPAFVHSEGTVTAEYFYGNGIFKNVETTGDVSLAGETVVVGVGNFQCGIATNSDVIVDEAVVVSQDILSTGDVVCDANFIGNGALLTDLSRPDVDITLQSLRDRLAALELKRKII